MGNGRRGSAWYIHSVAGQFVGLDSRAYSLHELKRTKEAQGVLLPIDARFPDEYIIQYNLACYACQIGNLKEALQWLEKTIDVAGKMDIRLMALEDDYLEPLWTRISEI